MNQKDRILLTRLYQVISDIPLPHMGGGSKTATIQGYVDFATDMREIRRVYLEIILAMLSPDDLDGLARANAETLLTALELWIADRSKAGWDSKHLYFDEYLEKAQARQRMTEAGE